VAASESIDVGILPSEHGDLVPSAYVCDDHLPVHERQTNL
jgi:hypothetical protein